MEPMPSPVFALQARMPALATAVTGGNYTEHDWVVPFVLVFGSVLVGLVVLQSLLLAFRQARANRLTKKWLVTKRLLLDSKASRDAWMAWLAVGETIAALREKDAEGATDDYSQALLQKANAIRADMRAIEAALTSASFAVAASKEPESQTIRELARMRSDAIISPEEFQAFTERFRRSSGVKAQEIIDAIGKLHQQKKAGAMSEGNYKASLWTLMDRLDSDTRM